MSNTFLTREDVRQSLIQSLVMSSFEQQVDVLFKDLTSCIQYNKEEERQADVKAHFAQEKRERTTERNKARKHNEALEAKEKAGEYVDINEYWFRSPPPHAITYRGVTVCGWCLCRKDETPKEECKFHYWKAKDGNKKR